MWFDREWVAQNTRMAIKKCVEVHREAGHGIRLVNDQSFRCETCLEEFHGSTVNNGVFGYAMHLAVSGLHAPYTTMIVEEIREIVYGTHHKYGIAANTGEEYVPAACPHCGRDYDEDYKT